MEVVINKATLADGTEVEIDVEGVGVVQAEGSVYLEPKVLNELTRLCGLVWSRN